MTRLSTLAALTFAFACAFSGPALAATDLYVTDTNGNELWGWSVADNGALVQVESETVQASASSIAFDNEAELMWVGSSAVSRVDGFTVGPTGTLTPDPTPPTAATTSPPTSIASDPFQAQLLTVLGGAASTLQSWSRGVGSPEMSEFGLPDAAGTNATDLVHYTTFGTTYVLRQNGVEMYDGGSAFPEPNGSVTLTGASSIALEPRLGRLYVGTTGGDIHIFSVAGDGTLDELGSSPFTPADTPVRMVVHPDGGALYATAAGGGVLQMAIGADGELSDIGTGSLDPGNQTGMRGIAITPDGDHVFTTSTGGTAGVQHFGVGAGLDLTAGATTMPAGGNDGNFDGLAIAVSPDQPADADLAVTSAPTTVGSSGTFDASGTTAADGDDVVAYDFHWGDGSPPTGGATPTPPPHQFNAPGIFEVRVLVTDETGTSEARVYDGRSTLRNGTRASSAYQVVSVAPASPPPAADATSGLFLTSGNSVFRFGLGAGGVPSGGAPVGGGHQPAMLVPSPDGRSLYVPSQGPEGDVIGQYDVTAGGGLSPKPAGLAASGLRPRWMAVTPDGRFAYASNFDDGDISVYTVGASGQLVPNGADEPLGPEPGGLAIHPSGDTLYAFYENFVQRFAIEANGTLTPAGAPVPAEPDMQDAAVTPAGTALYGVAFNGAVLEYAIGADRTLTPRPDEGTGCQPRGLAVAPDGRNAYVGCVNAGTTLRIFDIAADGSLGNQRGVAASNGLGHPVVSPDGGSVYVPGLGQTFLYDRAANGNLTPKSTPTIPNGGNGVAMSPSQAPVASFTVTPAPAGQATAFDARSSSDPDGAVARYDWDFGDGATLPNGGPTPTHVYASPAGYAPRLTVTDAEGTSTTRVFTGSAVSRNGGPSATTARIASVPPGPGAAQQPPPEPDYREEVLVEPVSGRVLVKVPGSNRFVPIEELTVLPVGSIVDVRRGRVELIVETGDGGPVQRAVFHGGIFQIRQLAGATASQRGRRPRPLTELVLRGDVGPCRGTAKQRARRSAGAAAGKKRRLWGNGKGRFRTKGRYSSATVRGTHWLTEDRCDGTLTQVRQGSVTVYDFVRKRLVTVKKGKRYLARPKQRRRR
jgi:6-phosphogluconolactonase (cycloisomerase 2 family)